MRRLLNRDTHSNPSLCCILDGLGLVYTGLLLIEGAMAQFNLSITIEYDLVSASHKLQLVAEVRKWIAKDWQPLGGAFAYDDEIHQTMVREKPKEPPKYNPDLQYNKE